MLIFFSVRASATKVRGLAA